MSKPYNPTGYDESCHWGFSDFDVQCVGLAIYKQCQADGINLQPRPLCALLGNIARESHMHSGMWESLNVGNIHGGYGLTQWTPCGDKIIPYLEGKGLPNDSLTGQVERLIHFECIVAPEQQWLTGRSVSGMSFKDFLENETYDIDYLTKDFMYGYESPSAPALDERITWANSFQTIVANIFGGSTDFTISSPIEPDTSTPDAGEEEIPEQEENLYELLQKTEYNTNQLTAEQVKKLKQRVIGDRIKIKTFCGKITNRYGTKVSIRKQYYRISEINQKGDFITIRGEHIKPHYIDV